MFVIYRQETDTFSLKESPCPICSKLSTTDYYKSDQHKRLSRNELVKTQGSAAWLRERSTRVTASEAGSVLGNNRFKSDADLLHEKVYGSTFKGNASTEWGNRWEDSAIRLYERKTGCKVAHYGLIQSPDDQCLAGSPDGVTYCGKLIEVKCPGDPRNVPRRGKTVPIYNIDQIQMLMWILDLPKACFIRFKPTGYDSINVINPDSGYKMHVVEVLRCPRWKRYNYFRLVQFHHQVCMAKSIDDGSFFRNYVSNS